MNNPINNDSIIISLIMAAGRGSRMNGYTGNKTLLPLCPVQSQFEGSRPIIEHIIDQLPEGPMALVVHHCKADVIAATGRWNVQYCVQPQLNGT
ncbi:MAG: NTP transferase domain-containing protein, partial [Desulfatitalea sp.]|nr:NTP transferase domain-containing protein [Desulfatitalea sp.]NNK00316.1 NTP transferase domain-containing protein [Desulfatitalea sp.]